MILTHEDIILEIARAEREAFRAVVAKIAARNEGQAFIDSEESNDERRAPQGH